jgi:hypothetical protein
LEGFFINGLVIGFKKWGVRGERDNSIKDDPELTEIISLLNKYPKDKKTVLKLLQGKENVREAIQGLQEEE